MVLNNLERGNLEKIIDDIIQRTPMTVKLARDEKYRKILKDKDGTDFVLGLVIGQIIPTFVIGFRRQNNRPLDQSEQNEMTEIVYKRIAEIKNAIFSSG